MKTSDRLEAIPKSPIRKLTPYADAAKERGISVIHLNIGQPDLSSPEVLPEAITKASADLIAYGPSEGLPEYIRALQGYYKKSIGLSLDREQILVTQGGSEALRFAFLATCDYGDEIIVPEPFYANVNTFAAEVGIKVVPVPTLLEDNFRIPSVEVFESVITPKTRAIHIANPGNPTGVVYTEKELLQLCELAEKHDLFIISDEVYREILYPGKSTKSILSFQQYQDRTIMVDSVSKRYNLCGARIGALVSCNKSIVQGLLKCSQGRLCPATLEQQILTTLVEAENDEYFERIVATYEQRRAAVVKGLDAIEGVTYSTPAGAFYLIAKLPIEDAEDFSQFLLEEFSLDGHTLMVAPAAGFYGTPGAGQDQIRIAFVLDLPQISLAMEILKCALEVYKRRG